MEFMVGLEEFGADIYLAIERALACIIEVLAEPCNYFSIFL
jgi:hypothetical protein